MKTNAICVVCGRPTPAPRGNFNLNRVVICHRVKCRRQRKTDVQKSRRSLGGKLTKAQRKLRFYGQIA